MKIVCDYQLCQGHGVCEGEAPEVFKVEDNGNLTILNENPGPQLHEKVRKAVEYCPTQALSLEE